MTLAVHTEGPLKQMTKASPHLCNENLFYTEMWWSELDICYTSAESVKRTKRQMEAMFINMTALFY